LIQTEENGYIDGKGNQPMSKREDILEVLRGQRDKYVSGEDLAKVFGLSRTAVWKSINVLKSEGYGIMSSKRMGYRLTKIPDRLLPAEIRDGLKTEFLGKYIIYYPEISSTQTEAKKLAYCKDLSEGSLIISEKQTQAVGRLGRSWESPLGGLWFSFILKPGMTLSEANKITHIVALSVSRSIRNLFAVEALIKWPNDIVVYERGCIKKICGILTELTAELDRVNLVVVGVGINVNNSVSPSLKRAATSLRVVAGRKIPRVQLLQQILKEIEMNYNLLRKNNISAIWEELKSHSLLLGKKVEIQLPFEEVVGYVVNLDHEGALIVRTDSRIRRITAGEITKLNPEGDKQRLR